MNIVERLTVVNLISEIKTNSDSVINLALSHEELRSLVKELLAEIASPSENSKELLSRARTIVGS